MCLQGASTSETVTTERPGASQLAEGVAVLNQELKTPEQKTRANTGQMMEEDHNSDSSVRQDKDGPAKPAYSSAAAFLGFR